MDKKHKDLLGSKRVFLVEKLDMPALYDYLIETKLLSSDDQETLEVSRSIFAVTKFSYDVFLT